MAPSHRVTKLIDFCYGHRLLNYDGKCRHLHGHNGRLEVDLESSALDRLGMVVDFSIVRDVIRTFVDDNLDHRMLLCRSDPIVKVLESLGEPLFLMDENPTAENIARLVYRQGASAGLPIVEIRLWESPSSYATYRE
jgi:6-pyruvoyltetrahydropterin/6-carboxytetrahydropterin synthase